MFILLICLTRESKPYTEDKADGGSTFFLCLTQTGNRIRWAKGATVWNMAFCSHCGTKLNDGSRYCPQCGNATDSHMVYIQSPQQDIYVHTRKSKGLALTLCFFGGWFGLHEFYLRNYFTGSLYLLFCWTFIPLVLSVLDFILILLTPNSVFHRTFDK